ncbi:MAG: EexN family lipoprotein [Cycloclasticus sp.]
MMNTAKKLVLVAIVTLLLVACSESTRTTEWYMQNTKEQGNDLDECNRNPEMKGTTNCINANEAELIIQQGTDAIKAYLAGKGL